MSSVVKPWTYFLIFAIPISTSGATPKIVQSTWEDGVFLYTSPSRLTQEDLPAAFAMTGLLGGSLALDRLTRRNLALYQDSGAATLFRHYGDYAQFGGIMLSGIFAINGWAAGDDQKKRISWDLLESFLWANAISGTFKVALGRRRPNATADPFELRPGSINGSFPSGHTISAFAGATMISEYYPTWKVEIPAYAAASAVAVSRFYANQHWGSDVVAGALLGYGVSHILWKRHHVGTQTVWDFVIEAEGIRLTRRF